MILCYLESCRNPGPLTLQSRNESIANPRLRWTLGAQEIVYDDKPKLIQRFFSAGRVIPVIRGKGIHQPGLNIAIEKLNKKEWVHIFPESKCNPNPEVSLLPFRWGIARLIMCAKEAPIVVPFYHRGLGNVMPLKSWRNGPRLGERVDVVFGEAIDTRDWRREIHELRDAESEASFRIKVTNKLQERMNLLKEKVDARLGNDLK